MPDLTSRVRFLGDAQQLLSTYRAIGSQAAALQRQIDQINRISLSRQGFNTNQGVAGRQFLGNDARGNPQFKNVYDTARPAIRGLTTELDKANNTFRTFGKTAAYLADGTKVITGEFENVHGNAALVNSSMQALNQTTKQIGSSTLMLSNEFLRSGNAVAASITPIKQRTRAIVDHIRAQERAGIIDKATANYLVRQEGQNYSRAISNPASVEARNQYNNVRRSLPFIQKENAALLRQAQAGVARAYAAPAPIPASIQHLESFSPSLYKQLQAQGLGAGKQSYSQNLYNQGAGATFDKNLITGVTRAHVSFKDLNGVVNNSTFEFDKAGKQITRFGGALSGIQNFARQTVNNLQKVIQWTVATTAVFGTLAFAVNSLRTITELDKSLKQLAITSQSTAQDTRVLFEGLANISYQTATPLTELVKAADDIALATRGAGKTAQEYRKDILNLAEAVGIYTNLTGVDTVKATDILTSTMKQLGIETEDVVGILSKITAVAGGQSNAIADISQGLAVMAEAARQAGLSVDETIAAVQVLSQVTAKSPSEVATAFKNLVGSLDSPGGTKALAKYNIALRDSQGNLKNILTIYKEVSDKIRQGIIPTGDVKGLVKAIAGGPRRAPDAAALLSNIDNIQAVTERSVNATNEALIANAKILDTTQAKIIQLQSALDRFAFEKFGEAFKQFVSSLAVGITSLLNVLNQIPTGVIAAGLQLGVFFLSLKAGMAILKFFARTLGELGTTFLATGAKAGLAGKQIAQAGGGGRFGGIAGIAGIKGSLAGIAGSAVVGAGLSAATGGNPLGGLLQGAGLAALAAPIPLPWLKVAGAISLAAGTIIEFVGASHKADDANTSAAETAQKVLAAYGRYDEAAKNLSNLAQSQTDLRAAMDLINGKDKKSATDLAQLNDYQKQYVDNVLAMADATNQLGVAQKEIAALSPGFKQAIEAAQRGELGGKDLEAQIQALQLQILRITNPNAQLPGGVSIPQPQNVGFAPYSGDTQAQTTQRTGGKYGNLLKVAPVDLEGLKTDASQVKQLFNSTGTELTATFQATGHNIDLVNEALQKLKAAGDPAADTLLRTFGGFAAQSDAIRGAEQNMTQYQARIDALKLFKPEQAAELQKIFDLVQKIILEAGKKGDSQAIFSAQSSLAGFLSGSTPINKDTLLPIVEQYANLTGATQGLTDKNIALQAIIDSVGLHYRVLGVDASGALKVIDEETAKVAENIGKFKEDALTGFATKSADLQAQHQSGEITNADYSTQIAQLNALRDSVSSVADAYQTAVEDVPGFTSTLQSLSGSLTNINGLQDAQSLTADQLIGRMFDLATTYGLTGEQVELLKGKMLSLLNVTSTLSAIKAQFNLAANVDVKQAIAALKAIRAASTTTYDQYGHYVQGTGAPPGLDEAIAKLEAVQGMSSGLGGSIGKIYGSGKGSSKGGGGSKKKGFDVSNVDIPDAIANSSNQSALLQEAIKRAKALQAKIPGAGKEAKNDIVELLKGTQRVLEVRGVKDDLLRRALQELADIEKKRLEFETKADTIRRIRVGGGDFAAIANVPVNSKTGVSLGGPGQGINVTLNLNGTVLTPAQFAQFADMIGASIKRQIAN